MHLPDGDSRCTLLRMDIHDYLAQTRMLRSEPALQVNDAVAQTVRGLVASDLHRPIQMVPVYSSLMSHELVTLSGDTFFVTDYHLIEAIADINALLFRVAGALEFDEPDERREAIRRSRSSFRSILLRTLSTQLWQSPSISLALAEESHAARDEHLFQLFPRTEDLDFFLREVLIGQEVFTYLQEVFRFLYREDSTGYQARRESLAKAFAQYRELLGDWAETRLAEESAWPVARWKGGGEEIERIAVEDVDAVEHGEHPDLLMELVCTEAATHDVFTVNGILREAKDDATFASNYCLSEIQVFLAAHYLSAIRRLVTFWKSLTPTSPAGLRESIKQATRELNADARFDPLRFFVSPTFASGQVLSENNHRAMERLEGISESYRAVKDLYLNILFQEILRLISPEGVIEVFERATELERRLGPGPMAKQRQRLLGW